MEALFYQDWVSRGSFIFCGSPCIELIEHARRFIDASAGHTTRVRAIKLHPNAKCQMPNAKCQMPNAKCQMPKKPYFFFINFVNLRNACTRTLFFKMGDQPRRSPVVPSAIQDHFQKLNRSLCLVIFPWLNSNLERTTL